MSTWTDQQAHLGDRVGMGLGNRVVRGGTVVVLSGAAPGITGDPPTVGEALQRLDRGGGVAATQRPGVNIKRGNAHSDVTISRRDGWRHVMGGQVPAITQHVCRAVSCTSRQWPS